jgi:hypothetical protein
VRTLKLHPSNLNPFLNNPKKLTINELNSWNVFEDDEPKSIVSS